MLCTLPCEPRPWPPGLPLTQGPSSFTLPPAAQQHEWAGRASEVLFGIEFALERKRPLPKFGLGLALQELSDRAHATFYSLHSHSLENVVQHNRERGLYLQ